MWHCVLSGSAWRIGALGIRDTASAFPCLFPGRDLRWTSISHSSSHRATLPSGSLNGFVQGRDHRRGNLGSVSRNTPGTKVLCESRWATGVCTTPFWSH